MSTKSRIDYMKFLPEGRAALLGVEKVVHDSDLDPLLLELVKLRSSQINGCAFCVDMHTKDALALGEHQQRLHLVAVWHEASCFSVKERTALEWAETLTVLTPAGISDELYRRATAEFSEKELSTLTLAIAMINVWNRMNVVFHRPAGDYISQRRPLEQVRTS